MIVQLVYLSLAIISFTAITGTSSTGPDEGHCIWYGECDTSFFGSKTNCPYDGPAKEVNQSAPAWETFQHMCPDLVKEGETNGLCCDPDMIETFSAAQGIPRAFLGACSTCYHNFRHLWCQSACHPRQSGFMAIVANETNDEGVGHVTEVSYYVTSHYAQSLFNSCQGVKKHGMSALGMMCGGLDAEECTAEAWLTYLGNNDFAPFITHFHIVNETSTTTSLPVGIAPVNITAIGCGEGVGGEPGCVCEQCSSAC